MQGFLYKLKQFMYGRNGLDGLGIGLFVLYFILNNISYYSRSWILNIIAIAVLVFMIFRLLSANIVKRRAENDFFMYYFRKVRSWYTRHADLAKDRARVKDTHKIYLCPECKRKLKVPKGRGKLEIKCICGNKFTKRT